MNEDTAHQTLEWASKIKVSKLVIYNPLLKSIHDNFEDDLTKYWRLALISRGKGGGEAEKNKAINLIFRVRTIIEKSIECSVHGGIGSGNIQLENLFEKSVFSKSIKQGLSLRLPLTSCVPTKTCKWGCYAHDGMDAGRYPVIKGAINGMIAKMYENGSDNERKKIKDLLKKNVLSAVKQSIRESDQSSFKRQPRIRFSHVGEIADFPDFANMFAKLVSELSNGQVQPVVYTRHPNANLLNTQLFVINFSLDNDSSDRKSWVPPGARVVYSAWNGEVSKDASVNFLEHHRFSHSNPSGEGYVCPVTRLELNVKTCDEARCDLCFQQSDANQTVDY